MSLIFPPIVFRWWTADGLPAVGYRVYFYTANGAYNTLKNIYSDYALTTPVTNPVTLNAEGYAAVYAGTGTYQVRIRKPVGDDTVVYSSSTIDGSDLTTVPIFAATVAAMRLLTAGSASLVIVGNYSTDLNPDGAGDGGGGVFVWDSTCTLADDGVIVFAPTSAPAQGRYIRQFSGPVDLRFGGQVGNGTAQTSPSIAGVLNAAVTYATSMQEAASGRAQVYFPPGNYLISDNETWNQNVELIFAQGAYFSIAATKTLTIQCKFQKGRDNLFKYSSPTYTGVVNLAAAKLEDVMPEWWGTDDAAFERMCASAFTGKAVLEESTIYSISQTATISFPGIGIVGNMAVLLLTENIAITFAAFDAFIKDVLIDGDALYNLSLTGTNAVIDNLDANYMNAPVNSGAVVFTFSRLAANVRISSESAAAGSSCGRVIGGTVNLLSSRVENLAGVKYGWSFETAARVTLIGPIDGTPDTADYIVAGGALYSIYGVDAFIGGTLSDFTAAAATIAALSATTVTASGLISSSAGAVSAATTVTAGTGVTATTGNITATAGNIVATAGAVTSGTFVQAKAGTGTQNFRAGGNIVATIGTGSFSLPANTLVTDGDMLRIIIDGTCTPTGAQTATFATTFGGVAMTTTAITIITEDGPYKFRLEIIVKKTAANEITWHAMLIARATTATSIMGENGTSAPTLTNACTIASSFAVAVGTIAQSAMYVDFFPAAT